MPDVALVVGCSSGIGLATACLLANDPQKRFMVYATLLKPVDQEMDFRSAVGDALYNTIHPVVMDVTKEETIVDAVAMVLSRHGLIDILINIAGVNLLDVSETVHMDILKRVFDVNFFGMVRVIQEVLPHMKRRRAGRIVNMGSVHGLVAFPYMGLYGATKQAILAFSQETATIGRFFNIRVSVIEPGAVNTNINQNMISQNLGGYDKVRCNPDVDDIDRELAQCHVEPEMFHEALLAPHYAQEAGDIAELILRVVTDENPHFRYQTSEACRAIADRFLKDVTGDSFIDYQVAELESFRARLRGKNQETS